MTSSIKFSSRRCHACQGTALLALVVSAAARGADHQRVYYDRAASDGSLSGGWVVQPMPPEGGPAAAPPAEVVVLESNGDAANRIDLVYVGDGYRNDDLEQYAAHVDDAVAQLFGEEPFAGYRTFFNVMRVNVISAESGVDHDPAEGVLRDTALDMGFFCSGIEWLLCVNVSTAWSYASNAADVDQVLAVANSGKYGGAGYAGSDLATFAGGNGFAPEIATHEMGHSLANLADEYYSGDSVWLGAEPTPRNISTLPADAMADAGTKWSPWLGDPGIGYGGFIATFEGAAHYRYGVYRPTFNSKMRTLGQPFNLPSIEAFIIEFYKLVDPIDDSTPTSAQLDGHEQVWVNPVDPVSHALSVQWFLNREPISGANGTSIDLDDVSLPNGVFELSVRVRDDTSLVRDEAAREAWLTQELAWQGQTAVPPCRADINGDGFVGVDDLLRAITSWGACSGCDDDVNQDGIVNGGDIDDIVGSWGPCN